MHSKTVVRSVRLRQAEDNKLQAIHELYKEEWLRVATEYPSVVNKAWTIGDTLQRVIDEHFDCLGLSGKEGVYSDMSPEDWEKYNRIFMKKGTS